MGLDDEFECTPIILAHLLSHSLPQALKGFHYRIIFISRRNPIARLHNILNKYGHAQHVGEECGP